MSDWEKFQSAYQAATPELKALVDSETIPMCVDTSLRRRQGERLQSAATVQLSHLMIGAQTIDATVNSLKQLGISDALQFIVEIQNCTQQPSQTQPKPVENQANAIRKEVPHSTHDSSPLQNVRTMPHDMAAIKPGSDIVYQSSQADILTRNGGEVPNIASAVPEAPRWDTDTKQ